MDIHKTGLVFTIAFAVVFLSSVTLPLVKKKMSTSGLERETEWPRNASSGIAGLRMIHISQQQFRVLKKGFNERGEVRYATLDELVEVGLLDQYNLKYCDYRYEIYFKDRERDYEIYAIPVNEEAEGPPLYFYMNASDNIQIRYEFGGMAGPNSKLID